MTTPHKAITEAEMIEWLDAKIAECQAGGCAHNLPWHQHIRAFIKAHSEPYDENWTMQEVKPSEHDKAFKCGASANTSADTPQECNWPVCGCDEYADKVISALQEHGHIIAEQPNKPAPNHTECSFCGEIIPLGYTHRHLDGPLEKGETKPAEFAVIRDALIEYAILADIKESKIDAENAEIAIAALDAIENSTECESMTEGGASCKGGIPNTAQHVEGVGMKAAGITGTPIGGFKPLQFETD